MKLVFMRHAEPDVPPGAFYGFTDHPLTPKGRQHASESGKALAGMRFDHVFSSPLARAADTMTLACQAAKIDCSGCVFDDRLKEMNFGSLENMNYEQVCATYPEAAHALESDWLHAKLDGECALEFFNRVASFCEYVKTLEGDSFIVCHNGVIRAAIVHLLSLDKEAFWKLDISYCKTAAVAISRGHAFLAL